MIAAFQSNIPDNWAIDIDGNSTMDPALEIAGTILPMAGHKGYAISTLMDVLSGVLTGSQPGQAIVGPYVKDGESGVGHFVIATNIEAARGLAAFEADMEKLITEVKDTPRRPGVSEIFYPGELEALADVKNRADGIELPEDTAAELREQATKLGIDSPFDA